MVNRLKMATKLNNFFKNNKENIIIGAIIGIIIFIFGFWFKSRYDDKTSNVGGNKKSG